MLSRLSNVQNARAEFRNNHGRFGDSDGCVDGDGAVYVSAARRMNGVVNPQHTATSRNDAIQANGEGVEGSDIIARRNLSWAEMGTSETIELESLSEY